MELKSCAQIDFNRQLLGDLSFLFDDASEFGKFGNGVGASLKCLFKG